MNKINLTNSKTTKVALIFAICMVLIISQTGCGSKDEGPVSAQGMYLNTQCSISIYETEDGVNGQKLADNGLDEIGRYESIMSRTVPGSDIDRLNKAGGSFVKVSRDTLEVIKLGIEMGDESNGAFDITLGGVSELWDFSGEPKVPDDDKIKAALPESGYKSIEIDEDKVRMTDPKARMDLGAIAKGYIADRISEYLEEGGATRAIISLGGNVVAIGQKAENTPFVVGVERPYSDRTEMIGTIDAKDMTLVTSGVYERYFEENGVKYHHVLNKATGYPVETDIESVTVVADKGNSAICDATSTACLLLGVSGAKEFVKAMQKKYPDIHMEAAFMDINDNISYTEGMKLKIKED